MLTRKALNHRISSFVADLQTAGYTPSKVVLFGSYAKGKPNDLSDIDLAVCGKKLNAVVLLMLNLLPQSFQNTHG